MIVLLNIKLLDDTGVVLLATTLVAIFEEYEDAEKAAYEIRNKGLRTDNISIISKTEEKFNKYNTNGEKYSLGANINNLSLYAFKSRRSKISDGVITGGICGGLAGIVIGAASMFIQGMGLVAATGPIGGLFIGLITGGVIGGIIDVGIPKSKRHEYEKLISYGRILLSMKADEERSEDILEILNNNGALMVEKYE